MYKEAAFTHYGFLKNLSIELGCKAFPTQTLGAELPNAYYTHVKQLSKRLFAGGAAKPCFAGLSKALLLKTSPHQSDGEVFPFLFPSENRKWKTSPRLCLPFFFEKRNQSSFFLWKKEGEEKWRGSQSEGRIIKRCCKALLNND